MGEKMKLFKITFLILILISITLGNSLVRKKKITEDTTQNRIQRRLFREPYSSQAIVRKDLNKSLMVTSDYGALNRILYSVGPANIDNTQAIKSYGDNPGDMSFDRPAGVAVDVFGNIFVADDDNDRIVVLGYNWNSQQVNFIRTIQAGFNKPVDVDVTKNLPNGSNHIWVVDKLNHRIVKLDYSGNVLTTYGSEGTGNGQFKYPSKICRGKTIETGYYLYILDRGNYRVVWLKHVNGITTWMGSRQLTTAVSDIAFDGELLWMVESPFTNRLVRYNADLTGNPIITFGFTGTGNNQFFEPRSMCVAFGINNGNLAVFDRAFVTELWNSGSGGQMYQLGVDIQSYNATGTQPYTAQFDVDLTDYCYLTINIKHNGTTVATIVNNTYTSAGAHTYTLIGNPGQYTAEFIATARYEPIINDARIQVIRTKIFFITDNSGGGGGGGGGVPPRCPFVFPSTANGYEEDNNILPDYFANNDTIDFYHLEKEPIRQDDFYYLMLGEDYADVSKIDQVQLMTIDYPEDFNIAVTSKGEIISYTKQIKPVHCIMGDGDNRLDDVLEPNDGIYLSASKEDSIICTFTNYEQEPKGGVGIVWRCKQRNSTVGQLNPDKSESESYIWSRQNWSEAFFRIEELPKGSFVFKISWPDSIMIDYIFYTVDEHSETVVEELNPIYAFHSAHNDVLSGLSTRDGEYVNLAKGERIIMAFRYNPQHEAKRSFVLKTAGNYTKLHQRLFSNSHYSTAFNNGRHFVRVPNTRELHLVYESQGKIIYSYSLNKGERWYTQKIDNGLYPCIGTNYKGLPWIAYVKDGDLVCKMKRPDGTFKDILIFDGNENLFAGPPSMQLATGIENKSEYAYITYPVYEGSMPDGPGEQPPENISASYIYITLFDTLEARTHLLDIKTDPNISLSHPCVAVTPADLIHIVWQQKDEIWYITNTDKVTPENWKQVQWTPAYNLSNTGDISGHPFVESYGDIVSVVWKEGNPGEITRKQRYVWQPSEYEKWNDPENLSNSPDANSDYPQMSAGDVTLWQEEGEEHKYKVFANIQGKILCLTPEANNVSYVHTNVLVKDPKAPEIMVYYCYTDEITENELYEVKFNWYQFPEGVSGDINEVKYYDGKVGVEIASPYCELRTGYIDYGDYTIDYGNRLEYLLKYLDPCKYYLFQAIVYQDTTGTIRQKLEIEDSLNTTMRVYPSLPETINIYISPSSYKEDLESALEIIKTRGAFACIADFKIYEYEIIADSGSGSGPQSAGLERLPIPTMLYSPKPNPFTNRTEIRFQIPTKTKVDLKIYNTAGRVVNTLVNSEINPGYYTMTWSGKDDLNRTQANGIYFVRLKTKDYNATKKMIMVR